MDRDEQIQVCMDEMLEASARCWAADWDRRDTARELVGTFGEQVVRAAARELSMTHRSWLKWSQGKLSPEAAREAGKMLRTQVATWLGWAEDAARTPPELRRPDRSPQYQAREAR